MRIWQVTIRVAPGHEATPRRAEMMLILHTRGRRPPTGARARAARRARAGRRTADPNARRSTSRARACAAGPRRQPGRVTVVEATSDGRAGAGGHQLGGRGRPERRRRRADPARRRRQAAAESRPAPPLAVLRQRLAGQPYWVAPTAFFQVNNAQAEVLLARWPPRCPTRWTCWWTPIVAWARSPWPCWRRGAARRVVGIESDPAALASARWTGHLLHIPAQATGSRAGSKTCCRVWT